MGNKLGRSRQLVDEKYTRPQGLYQHKDVDHKKLRKLILDSKLAPCYLGDEECGHDLEECPICFLYYPSLNRSRCCMKGICTECFLQMKTPNSTRPTQCPYCKTTNYAVEYRGVKTKEEKGMEQIEEQRVIEAKIRIRKQELEEDEERMQKRQDVSFSSIAMAPGDVGCSRAPVTSSTSAIEGEEIVSLHEPSPSIRPSLRTRQNRNDDFDLGLEDLMVMEAIWLSIQEKGRHRNPMDGQSVPSERYKTKNPRVTPTMPRLAETSSSPSGGLACAIAALAERQQMGGESSINYNGNMSTTFNVPDGSRFSSRGEQVKESYHSAVSSVGFSPDNRLVMTTDGREWGVDHESEVAEVGIGRASCDAAEDDGGVCLLPPRDETEGGFQPVGGHIVPESFEEQMMLAMAVSLAEARARTSTPEVAWQ